MAGELTPVSVSSELAPVVQRGVLLASWSKMPRTEDAPPVCSWPLDTVEARARLHQVIQGESFALWDECLQHPCEFAVTDLAAHYGTFEPEERSGEVVEGSILTLIGPDGVFRTSSEWAYRSLQQIALLEGLPPWKPPLILRAERLPTRNKRMRLSLVMVGRSDRK